MISVTKLNLNDKGTSKVANQFRDRLMKGQEKLLLLEFYADAFQVVRLVISQSKLIAEIERSRRRKKSMRTIKFRAWDKKHRFEMAEVMIIDWNEGYLVTTECWNEDAQTGEAECAARLSEVELMQFTGLLDKNGKEIYEGDIAKHEASISLLRVVMPDCFDSLKHAEKWEVIGNIYENLELLAPRCAELVMCGVYDNDPDQILHHDKRCPAYENPELVGATEKSATDFPRRHQMYRWTPAELAIYKAVEAVEEAGADPLLTDAVNLLQQARDKVADYVDRDANTLKTCT